MGKDSKTEVGKVLEILGLFDFFHRGEKDSLYYMKDGQEMKVTDLLGGYGSNLLGHSNPELVELYTQLLKKNVPFATQLSNRKSAGQLAATLSELIAGHTGEESSVLFSNSGTEAVEVAIKHSEYARHEKLSSEIHRMHLFLQKVGTGEIKLSVQSREFLKKYFQYDGTTFELCQKAIQIQYQLLQNTCFIVLDRAFHGKTTGAISLTSEVHYSKQFHPIGIDRLVLNQGEEALWEEKLKKIMRPSFRWTDTIEGLLIEPTEQIQASAIVVEPVQGEGGIHPLTRFQSDAVSALAKKYSLPLVVDEIQSGMGRTGKFLASEHTDLKGDIYVFAKSLGGSLTKVGATAIRKSIFVKEFGLHHSSTFAEDEYSSQIALKTLGMIKRDQLLERATKQGTLFQQEVEKVKDRFPEIIQEVRGTGLMLGIEFNRLQNPNSRFLMFAMESGYFGYVLASYLLSQGFRTAPSLNASMVLRLEPSFYITNEEIFAFCETLVRLCEILKKENTFELIRHLLPIPKRIPNEPIKDYKLTKSVNGSIPASQKPVAKAAFIAHILNVDGLRLLDPSFASVPDKILRDFQIKTETLFKPTLTEKIMVGSSTGAFVELHFIGISESPEHISESLLNRKSEKLVQKIQSAIELAQDLGCTVVGLGGLTSIVMQNGKLALYDPGVCITTGNAFTVQACVEAVSKGAAELGIDLSNATLGVLGATGNIGSMYASLLTTQVRNMILIGRNNATNRLEKVAEELGNSKNISISTEMSDLKKCNLILTASNSPSPIVFADHIGDQPCLIVDVATPSDVDSNVLKLKPNTKVIQGGLIALPKNSQFNITGIPLPPGLTFACLAETLILGFKGYRDTFSYGKLTTTQVEQIKLWASELGFKLAALKSQKEPRNVQEVPRL